MAGARHHDAPLHAASYRTPGGALTVIVDPHAVGDRGPAPYGAAVAAGFDDVDALLARIEGTGRSLRRRSKVAEVTQALEAYAEGELDAIDPISVVQSGGPFQQQVWRAMRGVGAGRTATYAELAGLAGRPRAFRAAGTACATNLVAIFVPCHRILAAGSIGGYGYGIDIKVALLEHEGALL